MQLVNVKELALNVSEIISFYLIGLPFILILLLYLFILLIFRSKEQDGVVLQYKRGHTYVYNFDSVMTSEVQNSKGHHETEGEHTDLHSTTSTLKLVGTAKVYAEDACSYALQLSGMKLISTSPNNEVVEKPLTQGIQKPVHFTLNSAGVLGEELCTDPTDNTGGLNMKRAIVSLLQADKLENDVEVDVFGKCPTHTTVSTSDKTTVINKSRNLNGCSQRKRISNAFFAHDVPSQLGGGVSTLIKSEYHKQVKVENGVVNSVHLTEEYMNSLMASVMPTFVPVSARVVTNLKLKSSAPSSAPIPPPSASARTVTVVYQEPKMTNGKNLPALKNALTTLVKNLDGHVKQHSASGFIELIRLMRQSDVDTLLELGNAQHLTTPLTRSAYLDALFRTATPESAKAIMKQFSKLNDKEKVIALLSLKLLKTVDKETMQQATVITTRSSFTLFARVLSLSTLFLNYNCFS